MGSQQTINFEDYFDEASNVLDLSSFTGVGELTIEGCKSPLMQPVGEPRGPNSGEKVYDHYKGWNQDALQPKSITIRELAASVRTIRLQCIGHLALSVQLAAEQTIERSRSGDRSKPRQSSLDLVVDGCTDRASPLLLRIWDVTLLSQTCSFRVGPFSIRQE
jgi:hypothetical protein